MDISSVLASWLLDEASTTFEIPTSISLISQLEVARRCISTIHFVLIVACFLSLSVLCVPPTVHGCHSRSN